MSGIILDEMDILSELKNHAALISGFRSWYISRGKEMEISDQTAQLCFHKIPKTGGWVKKKRFLYISFRLHRQLH